MKKGILAILAIVSTVVLSGCGLRPTNPDPYRINLEVWGVFDDTDAYAELFGQYKELNPYIGEITYRKLPVETYKDDLLNALASGKGPDIFMIRNTWTESFKDKIVEAPATMITEKQYKDAFVDVAAYDFFDEAEKKIYAAPLSVDSLGLYYNKDLFNAAGITAPPKTWEEMLQVSRALTKVDSLGNIVQSGIALGTAGNINRSTDILSAMALQLGASDEKSPDRSKFFENGSVNKALDFYTQFARVNSSFYSWNARQHYTLDAFYEGTLAMMVNYSWQVPTLRQKNAKLNFGVAPLPQFSGTVPENYANYWAFAVAKNKTVEVTNEQDKALLPPDAESRNKLRTHEAWQLLSYLSLPHQGRITLQNGRTGTMKDFALSIDPAKKYLETTGKPAARRDLIEAQKSDVWLAPFSSGNLLAKNWPQSNPEAVEGYIMDMIDDVVFGRRSVGEAVSVTANRINTLR